MATSKQITQARRKLYKYYSGPEHNDYYTETDHLDVALSLMTPAQLAQFTRKCHRMHKLKRKARSVSRIALHRGGMIFNMEDFIDGKPCILPAKGHP